MPIAAAKTAPDFDAELADTRLKPDGYSAPTDRSGAAGRAAHLVGVIVESDDAAREKVTKAATGAMQPIVLEETRSIAEARTLLQRTAVDFLVIGQSIADGDAFEFAANLNAEPRFCTIPVIMTGQSVTLNLAQGALRSGASDVMAIDKLTPVQFHQTVKSVMRRGPALAVDDLARLSNLQAEHDTLCRLTQRNMRLAKANVIPLMSFAWRVVAGEQLNSTERPNVARKLARLTRNLVGLLDDSRISATIPHHGSAEQDVNLKEMVHAMVSDQTHELHQSRAHISVRDIPVLHCREDLMRMLMEELLLVAVRATRLGEVPEIELGTSMDTTGQPVLWLREAGMPLSARKQALANRGHDLTTTRLDTRRDEYSWSLCQRLTERLGGQFRIVDTGSEGSLVQMRFDRARVVEMSA
ncbi:MAG: hypothetical protein AAF666_02145 [Pseudomonadota bacterium]